MLQRTAPAIRLAPTAAVVLILLAGILVLAPQETRAYTPHGPIRIDGDAAFTAANGVTGGTGTPSDPYLIEGWEIAVPSSAPGIRIGATTAPFVIRNVFVYGSNATAYDGIQLIVTDGGRLENVTVTGAFSGVHFDGAYNATIVDSTLTGNRLRGIDVESSDRVLIRGNTFDRNGWEGVHLWSSREVSIERNTMISDSVLIYDRCSGPLPTCLDNFVTHSITPDNTVNGLPLRFLKDCSDVTLDGVPIGQLIVVNCTRVRAANLQLTDQDVGVEVAYSDGVTIETSVVRTNGQYGMFAYASADLRLTNNDIGASVNSGLGVFADQVSNANLSGNWIAGSLNGVRLWNSGPGTIVGNNITGHSGRGLQLDNSSGFRVHHNAFAGNGDQAADGGSGNVWDDGYPSGGNYWSDYHGRDCCEGAAQDACGNRDGLGDTPYAVPPGSFDRYPIVSFDASNTPPIPQIRPPARARAGDPTTLDATASFDFEDPSFDLEARWDFEGDGVWDTSWSTNKTATHVYPEPRDYRIFLEVRDRACAIGRAEFNLRVEPRPLPPPDPAAWAYASLGLAAGAAGIVLVFLWRTSQGRRTRGRT